MSSFFNTLESRRHFAVDLVCYGVQIDSFDPNTLTIRYTIAIANTGSSDTPVNGGGGIFLSQNLAVNDRDDVLLNGIGPSDTPHLSSKFLIGSALIRKDIAPGNYYLGAALDSQSQVEEPNNDNNYAFSASTINIPEMYNLSFDGTDQADTLSVDELANEVGININKSANFYPRDRIASLTLNGLSGNDVFSLFPTLDLRS